MVIEYAGTEIPAYLLDLQFGGIPGDIMATGMQSNRRSNHERLGDQSNRQLCQQRSCAYGTGHGKANSRLLPSAVTRVVALQRKHLRRRSTVALERERFKREQRMRKLCTDRPYF